VVAVFRLLRVRAHQAVVVALLGKQEAITSNSAFPQHADPARGLTAEPAIARLTVRPRGVREENVWMKEDLGLSGLSMHMVSP
jgi:hypothetical protein